MNAYCYYLSSPTYRLDQTDTKNAMAELQNFIDQYPESPRIDSCNKIYDLLRGKLEIKEYDITNQYFHIGDYKATIASTKNFIVEFPESTKVDELMYQSINSYYLLAVNSLESKKLERLNLAMESYLKLVDLYPKSNYLLKAESVYESCLKMKNNINKQLLPNSFYHFNLKMFLKFIPRYYISFSVTTSIARKLFYFKFIITRTSYNILMNIFNQKILCFFI